MKSKSRYNIAVDLHFLQVGRINSLRLKIWSLDGNGKMSDLVELYYYRYGAALFSNTHFYKPTVVELAAVMNLVGQYKLNPSAT